MRLARYTSAAFLLTLVVAAPSAAYAQIEEGLVPLQTARSEIERLRAGYATSFNAKDAAAVAAMYGAEAVWIKSDGKVVSGQSAIKTMLAQDAATFPHLVITSDSVRVFGNTAIDHGTLAFHPTGGGEVLEKYLVVLRRGMNGWTLVRAISVPVAK